MLSRILKAAGFVSQEEREDKLYSDLVRHEARIGGKLFGRVPAGVKREFFCLDETTWIFHEEKTYSDGQTSALTIRYEVRPDSIVKVQNGKYHYLSKAETKRFYEAAKLYYNRVNREIYAAV